jgi:hypothetical protein
MSKSNEVDKNFTAFQKMLPELLKTHPGKYALMHGKEIVEFFDTFGDAARFGQEKFGDIFSIQEVTSRGVNLGFLASYAMRHIST